MAYKNEFDKDGKSIEDGKRAENNFVRLFKKKFGVEPIKTPENQDKYDHIDYIMKIGSHEATVDVKSWKKNDKYVWVEFVSYGKLGWLYGKADYIAFENPDEQSFIVIDRKHLVAYVKCLCCVEFTNNKDEAVCKIYVRYKKDSNLYDCATKIPREYLNNPELKHWVLD